MKTLKLTAKDFKDQEYIGSENVADYDGNLEIEGKLGWLLFASIKVKGYIFAEAGTGIKAGTGIIEAGEGIEVGDGIEAGLSITCKPVLKFNDRLFAGTAIWKVEYGIVKETN